MDYEKMAALMKELEKFDTPTVTNVVATYPSKKDTCLGVYDPWLVDWYTDERMRCVYPELGPRCGFAVTCIYGVKDPNYGRLDFSNVVAALDESPKPTILVMEQKMPEELRRKNGLVGGNMATAMKRAGCVGLVSSGPARDLHEIREKDFQMLITGTAPGHGDFQVKAVNVPVHVCSMDVAPGEIIHMDEHGACKFPANILEQVVDLCKKLAGEEKVQQETMKNAQDVKTAGDMMKNYGV